MTDDLAFATIAELGAALRAKTVSPVALTEGLLERIGKVDPKLSSFLTVTPERALAEAHAAEKEIAAGKWRGPLHGIPYAAKDLFDTAGIRTTAGARVYEKRIPAEDAAAITRLHDAGAILLGKLSMIELAGALGQTSPKASMNGPCRNPWDTTRWTGGSSSGTAAAVAAGLVPFALGTEALNSLIGPASFCGATALLPTFGAVSRRGVMPVAWSFDRAGVMTRSAGDAATVLGVIGGRDARDRASVAAPPVDVKPAPLAKALFLPLGADAGVRAAFDAACAVLKESGLGVATGSLPDLPIQAVARMIVYVETRAAFEEILRSGRARELADPSHAGAGPVDPLAGPPTAFELVKAQRIRTLVQDAFEKLFRTADVIVAPSMPVDPPKIDDALAALDLVVPDVLSHAASLCGLAVVTVPCGFSPAKMPVGLRLVGAPFSESRLVALAQQFETRTDWRARRPPL